MLIDDIAMLDFTHLMTFDNATHFRLVSFMPLEKNSLEKIKLRC